MEMQKSEPRGGLPFGRRVAGSVNVYTGINYSSHCYTTIIHINMNTIYIRNAFPWLRCNDLFPTG